MDDFIKIYKSRSLSVLNTNPFFKAALVHLLFVRIHPFRDEDELLGQTTTYLQKCLQNKDFTNLSKSFILQ